MRRNSLQQIEDSYKRRGFSGAELRRALERDEEWRSIWQERRAKLNRKSKPTRREKTYVLSTDEDYEILRAIKDLEAMALTKDEKEIVRLLRTQLKHDWRSPLLHFLQALRRRAEKRKKNQSHK